MNTEALNIIFDIDTPSRLDAAVMAYGDWQTCDDEQLQEANEAAEELIGLRAEIERLTAAVEYLQNQQRNDNP